jgi:uncharacterized membrane protein (DUF485 family)
MSPTSSWIWKSLLLSAAITLVACVGFYLFLRIHQELEIPTSRSWQIGLVVFLTSAVFTLIYFRSRANY